MTTLRDFVWWLAQWNLHQRPLQRKIAAAVLASVYCKLESEGKDARSEIRRLADSGFVSEQMAELLHRAFHELERIELEFESKQGRLPNAAELEYGARLEAEDELKRELGGWDLPF